MPNVAVTPLSRLFCFELPAQPRSGEQALLGTHSVGMGAADEQQERKRPTAVIYERSNQSISKNQHIVLCPNVEWKLEYHQLQIAVTKSRTSQGLPE